MRQLRKFGYWVLGVGCWVSLLNVPVRAQNTEEGKREKGKGESETQAPNPQSSIANPQSSTEGLPILLLVVQRPLGTTEKREDINSALSLMLRTSVRESRKYQVILYSPDHPSIRRALLEHAIAASELAEPIAPAALQKLARLIGARNILMVSATLDKAGVKTDVRLMQDAGGDSWITPLYQPFTVDAQMGKLRLKNEQMLAFTVDNIDRDLGIPSHLADNIHLSKTVIIGAADPKKSKKDKTAKNTKSSKDKNTDTAKDTTDVAANAPTPPDTDNSSSDASGQKTVAKTSGAGETSEAGSRATSGTKGNETTRNNTVVKTNDPPPEKTSGGAKTGSQKTVKPPAKNARNAQIARNTDSAPPAGDGKTGTSGGNGNAGSGTIGANPVVGASEALPAALPRVTDGRVKEDANNRKNQPTILYTDAGASLLMEPTLIPPVPPSDKVNHEAAADRYRQTGDLANAIESLRQAINENPLDLNLRKKLIVAYQDRQMPDMAVSEIDRAIRLAPGDADLSRLRAGSLIGKGDTTNAIKTLRDVIAVNPKDTAAQVSLGDALLAESQFADAITAFESAARNDPKSPLPHRRLARVLAARAGSDTKQYAACLQQIEQARSLTPATDTQTYQGDYFEIMLLIESRMKDMLDQVNETLNGTGKRANADLMQHATDLKERAEAASDFLDKLPPAAGQDVTHNHYAQGAALLIQAIGYLRKYIPSNEAQLGNALRATCADALTELTNAHDRLITARGVLEKGRAATGSSTN